MRTLGSDATYPLVIDVYESAIDATGRFGAVFERDDETAFFYLLDLRLPEGNQIAEAFNAHTVTQMPGETPAAVEWSSTGEVVGLHAGGALIAVFDLRNDARQGRWATDEDARLFVRH